MLGDISQIVTDTETGSQEPLRTSIEVRKTGKYIIIIVLACPSGFGFGFLGESSETDVHRKYDHILFRCGTYPMEKFVIHSKFHRVRQPCVPQWLVQSCVFVRLTATYGDQNFSHTT